MRSGGGNCRVEAEVHRTCTYMAPWVWGLGHGKGCGVAGVSKQIFRGSEHCGHIAGLDLCWPSLVQWQF